MEDTTDIKPPEDSPSGRTTCYAFDASRYCIVFCPKHSSVVQMTSNIADKRTAEMMVAAMKERGDYVFRACSVGTLIAALELIVKKKEVV